MENESLKLLTPPPEERLIGWLREFYGKSVEIADRQVLRHRDLSFVERLSFREALPESLIYKVVLPPWDVEQDLHERILIPSISNSARLFLSGNYGQLTALFMEDLGTESLLPGTTQQTATVIGTELAKMHRAYEYRVPDELAPLGILRTLKPGQYEELAANHHKALVEWGILAADDARLQNLGLLLDERLAGEKLSLVHGDLYAENIILRAGKFFIIDWSWFTMIGIPILDLATLLSDHFKNGEPEHRGWQTVVWDAYCFESGRDGEAAVELKRRLPAAYTLSRLLFLDWLIERRGRGIMGTTVGPVDGVIQKMVQELAERSASLAST